MKDDCNIWPWLMMTVKPAYVEKSIPFVFQVRLDESQIDEGFKSLFRQLAGPVSMTNRQQRFCAVQPYFDYLLPFTWLFEISCLCWQDMEISVTELQTILNRIIKKRQYSPLLFVEIWVVFHSQSLLGKLYPFIMNSNNVRFFVFSIFSLAHLAFSCRQIKTLRRMASQKKPAAAWSTSWMYPQSLDVILCVIFKTLWA